MCLVTISMYHSPFMRRYSHSASMPISLHFLSLHSWHFLRMYMSISQFPPLLHLYTAFFVMLRLKKPEHSSHIQWDQPQYGTFQPNLYCFYLTSVVSRVATFLTVVQQSDHHMNSTLWNDDFFIYSLLCQLFVTRKYFWQGVKDKITALIMAHGESQEPSWQWARKGQQQSKRVGTHYTHTHAFFKLWNSY